MIFLGLAIAAGLYLVSRAFNLYLTYLTLRYFVSVSVIVFAIIFQAEIRKYFEFLGLIGTRQIRVGPLASRSPSANEIIQACVQMAQSKIGALIVLQGKDNIDPYVDGGVILDAVISEDILTSIFDPHSDGHDGAVLINNNRISKFAAHLPLSTNFKEIGKHGTRHGAALGISENTDAFCIVVSEEKGKITVCREGKLKTLKQYEDLEKEVEKFIKDKFNLPTKKGVRSAIKNNLWLKTGAITSAVLIWFFTAFQAGIIEKTYNVPVILDGLPKNVLVENYNPKEIKVIVSGRGDAVFEGITEEDFDITFDTSDLKNGVNKKVILKKNIIVPTNLALINFEPDSVLLTAEAFYSAEVNISAKVTGEVGNEYELKGIEVTPEQIEIWISEGAETPQEILTETIDISDKIESVIIPVKLVVPEGIKLANGDSVVNVALTIEKRQ